MSYTLQRIPWLRWMDFKLHRAEVCKIPLNIRNFASLQMPNAKFFIMSVPNANWFSWSRSLWEIDIKLL